MVSRDQLLSFVAAGDSYEHIAARLGISPGLAFMIVTGLPADGSDSLAPEDRERAGFIRTSTQHLAHPAAVDNPTHRDAVQRWIDARVRQDGQMQQAGARDEPKPPALGDTGDNADVGAVIARDHEHFHKLAHELMVLPSAQEGGAPDQVARRGKIVEAIRAALPRHDAAEERHMWPAVRQVLHDGDAIAAEARSQEQEAANTLDALASHDPSSKQFDELVTRLEHQLRVHVAFEDQVTLKLRAAMSDEQRASVGQQLSEAERSQDGPS